MKKSVYLLATVLFLASCSLPDFSPLESYSTKFTVQDPKTAYIKAINCMGSSFNSGSNAPMFSFQSDTLYTFKSTIHFLAKGMMDMAFDHRANINYMTIENNVTIEINNLELCIDNHCGGESRYAAEANKRAHEILLDLEQCIKK